MTCLYLNALVNEDNVRNNNGLYRGSTDVFLLVIYISCNEIKLNYKQVLKNVSWRVNRRCAALRSEAEAGPYVSA